MRILNQCAPQGEKIEAAAWTEHNRGKLARPEEQSLAKTIRLPPINNTHHLGSVSHGEDGPTIDIIINGKSVLALVDTGATISVMRPCLISVGQRQDTRTTLLDAGGKGITVEGTTIAELEIGNFCTLHAIVIAAIQNDAIIGQDLMQKHDCILDWNLQYSWYFGFHESSWCEK